MVVWVPGEKFRNSPARENMHQESKEEVRKNHHLSEGRGGARKATEGDSTT